MAWPRPAELWRDVVMAWRGYRRVAPYGARGRIYAPRAGEVEAPAVAAVARPVGTLGIRVIRADGRVETHPEQPIVR